MYINTILINIYKLGLTFFILLNCIWLVVDNSFDIIFILNCVHWVEEINITQKKIGLIVCNGYGIKPCFKPK
jgi:hypothetical protein